VCARKTFSEAQMVETNQNQRRTIRDSIAYSSLRDFTSITRPSINEKIVEIKPALL